MVTVWTRRCAVDACVGGIYTTSPAEYMAPEMYVNRDAPYEIPVDIWAMGKIGLTTHNSTHRIPHSNHARHLIPYLT